MSVTESRLWLVLASLVLGGLLVYLLGPVLTPFLVAALLAYLGDPLADRLERWRLPRTAAVVVVFLVFTLAFAALLLLLVPLLEGQLARLANAFPRGLEWLSDQVIPRLEGLLGLELTRPDLGSLKAMLTEHWRQAGGAAAAAARYLGGSGMALAALVANLLLIPVVTFYLLRDWDVLMARLRDLLPRDWESTVVGLAREVDEVLAAFLRGQLTVMLALAVIYSVGLWIVGLELALAVGLLAGFVSFVPYLGVVVGVVVASAAMLFQTGDPMQLLGVGAVFLVGQMLEGNVLTPWLVGDRIGLHPVAVIFAVLAGGQLFGFIGVLIALPVAAVVAVLLRHIQRGYKGSALYGRGGAQLRADPEDGG